MDRENTRSILSQCLARDDPPKSRLIVARKNIADTRIAEMPDYQLAEDVPEVGGNVQVPLLVELLARESGPVAINLATLNSAAEAEHDISVAVVGAARSVLFRRAAELAHRDYAHIGHPFSQVLVERGQRLAKLRKKIRQLPGGGLCADLVYVVV